MKKHLNIHEESMKENPLKEKSYDFALRIIACCKTLQVEHHEYVLSRQLVRAGTSIVRIPKKLLEPNQSGISYLKSQLLTKRQERQVIGFACCATVT